MGKQPEQAPRSLEAVYLEPHLDNPNDLRRSVIGAAVAHGYSHEEARKTFTKMSDQELREHVIRHITPKNQSQT